MKNRFGMSKVSQNAPYRIASLGNVISANPPTSPQFSVNTRSFTVETTTVSKQALPTNAQRKSLLVQNLSGDTIYLNIDAPASASPIAGIAIFTGGNYEPSFVPTGAVWVVGTTGTQAVVVMEGF